MRLPLQNQNLAEYHFEFPLPQKVIHINMALFCLLNHFIQFICSSL